MSRADTLPVLGPIAVLSLFAASCALTAGYCQGKYLEEGVAPPGWWLLAFGWMTFPLAGPLALAWFANPLLVPALVTFWKQHYAKCTFWAGIATGLSVMPLFAFLTELGPGEFHLQPEPAWVFSTKWIRTELHAGYFTWAASHGLMFIIALACWMQSRRTAGGEESMKSMDCRDDEVL